MTSGASDRQPSESCGLARQKSARQLNHQNPHACRSVEHKATNCSKADQEFRLRTDHARSENVYFAGVPELPVKIVSAGGVVPCQPQRVNHLRVAGGGALAGFKLRPGRLGSQQASFLPH